MIKLRAVLEMFTKGTDKAKKEVTGINRELEEAADAAARMNDTLSRTRTGQTAMARAGVVQDYRTQRSVTGSRGAEGRDFAGLAQGGGGQGFVAAYATLAANIFAVTAAFQALSNAAKTEQLAAGLDLVGARAGVALGITSKGLQQVTDYAITSADAMRAVAQASAAGFKGDEILRLGQVAKGASVALGRDLGDAMDRLIKGTIKLEPELLDELGIMTRLDDAVKQYADANGKAVSALTQTERRQAFLNAVLEEGERKFGNISDQVEVNPYDKLASSIKDLGTEFLKFANDILGPFVKLITEVPVLGLVPALGILSQALSKVMPNLDSFYDKVEGRASKLSAKQNFVSGLIPEAEAQFMGAKTGSQDEAEAIKEVNRLRKEELNLQARINLEARQNLITGTFQENVRRRGIVFATQELMIAQSALATDYKRLGAQTSITNLTKARAAFSAISGAATFLMASLSSVLIGITLIVAAIGLGVAAFKFFFPPSNLDKKLDESKKKMLELADQTKQTADQIRLMLEPGKGQAGNAFDAIANSAAAASAEIEKYNKLIERKNEEEEKGIKVRVKYFTTGTSGIGVNQNEYATREAAQRAADLGEGSGQVFEQTGDAAMSIDQAYRAAEVSLEKQLNISKEQSKLLVGNFRVILSQLSVEEEAEALSGRNLSKLQETVKAVGEMGVRFKDLEESAKNINKLSRDLFPKESENALRDLSKEYNSFYNVLKVVPAEAVKDTFIRGLAQTFLAQKSGVEGTLDALKNQGVEIEGINSLLDKSVSLERAQKTLADAKLSGDKESIKNAEDDVVLAERALGAALRENPELQNKLALETKILSVKKDSLTKALALYNLEERLAATLGANAKSALEYNKSIRNASLLATGADITVPEEATYEYKAKIAALEADTARRVADIKKRSIDLEMQLQLFELDNQKLKLERETLGYGLATKVAKSLGKDINIFDASGSLKSYEEISAIIRDTGNQESANLLVKRYELALLNEQKEAITSLASENRAAADSTANSANAASITANALLTSLGKQLVITKYMLKEDQKRIQSAQKLADIQIANNNELFKGASLSEEASAYLAVTKLPALKNEKSLAENLRDIQQDSLNRAIASKSYNDLELKAFQDKVDLATQEVTLIDQQIQGITDLNNSYQNGLQSRRVALDLAQKELQAARDLQASRKALRDSEINLARSQIEKTARQQGREVTPFEQEKLKASKEASDIQSALEERRLMSIEHILALENLKLERDLTIALYDAQYAVVKAQLIAAGKTEKQAEEELSPLNTLIGKIGSSFDRQINTLGSVQRNAEKTADNNIKAMVNDAAGRVSADLTPLKTTANDIINAVSTGNVTNLIAAISNLPTNLLAAFKGGAVAEEDPETILARMQRETTADQMNAANKGLQDAALGAAAPLFDEAPEGREAALGDKNRSAELQKQARALGEINMQATLLSDLSNTIDDGFTNIFLAAEQGSKAMRDAFIDMAKQILKQIALMTIKMLAFKAIEMGLNLIAPGAGTAFVNFINPGAAGGIIPLATGGIMDRAMGLQGVVKQPTYLVGEGRYNEAVVPLPNGRSIPVQMHGGGSQSNNVAVTVNMSNNGSQTQSQGQDPAKLGQAIAAAVQRELVAQKAPGGLLNRYSAI